jgi:hypothetical protein
MNMEVTLSKEAAEALAFGDAMVDAEGGLLDVRSIAGLCSLPELTQGGKPIQAEGAALLRGMFEKACKEKEVDPGARMFFSYHEVDFEGERRLLHHCLPYEHGGRTFNPRWRSEAIEPARGGKGKGKGAEAFEPPRIEWKDFVAPYLFHDRRMITVESVEGIIQTNNPDLPAKVQDIYRGLTDDRRWINVRLSPDADHKELCQIGCHVDQTGMARWREAMKAQVGSHAHLHEIYCTPAKGWMRFPGCSAPHYVYGDRVVAPAGSPELRAVARGNSGAAAPMGVSIQGSMAAQKETLGLAMRNAAIAASLGFAASSALLGLNSEMEAGILHFVGGSSKGKSTALKVAASLIGSAEGPREATAYVQSWNSTENAMEAPLEARSDAPSLYDELYELPQNVDILALLYRATNGRGKQRMTRDIEARMVKVWKTQILSTGEGSFASRIAQDGHEFPGGLQFRVMELHIETVPFWDHVELEGSKEGHGAYGRLVESQRASAPTAQGRIIESIEMSLKRNHGHFWERWIAMLQTPAGATAASAWFEEERGALESLIPAGANPVFIRRTKHIAAAMAGLRGILAIFEYGAQESSEIMEAARAWAREHLWGAGINVMGSENTDINEKFRDWILARESEFMRVGAPWAPARPSIGWIDRAGGCFISGEELKKVAAQELKIDFGRLQTSMKNNGWTRERKRHPSGNRESSAIWVWLKPEMFRALSPLGKPQDPPEPESASATWGKAGA